MKRRRQEKNLDGLEAGEFDSLLVDGDGIITGDLVVEGNVVAGGISGGPVTTDAFLATASTNQFKTTSANLDLQIGTPTGTVRLRNSNNTATGVVLQAESIDTASITTRFLTTQENVTVGTVNQDTFRVLNISNQSLGVNTQTGVTLSTDNGQGVIFKNGPNRIADGGVNTMTIRNENGTLRLQSQTGTLTIGPTSTLDTNLTVNNVTCTGLTSTSLITEQDGLVGNTDINGGRFLLLRNLSLGTEATTILLFQTNGGDAVMFKNGPNRTVDGGVNTLTVRNNNGLLRLQSNTATLSISANSTLDGNLTLANVTATGITGINVVTSTMTTGTLTTTGVSTYSAVMNSTNTTDAGSVLNGAFYTLGGIKALKTIFAGQGFQLPYGQFLKSDSTLTIQTNMMGASFGLVGGVANDGLYLYTPGSTAGAASTGFVLGINEGQAKFPQTTVSSSNTTGAVVVAGGVGIGGNLHVGGTITGGSVSYGSTTSGTFAVTNGSGTTFTVASTQVSSSPSTGAAVVEGGVGIKGDLNVQGTITGGAISYGSTSTGTLTVTNSPGTTVSISSTENSFNSTTGALIIEGGSSIKKNTFIGGDLSVGTSTQIDGDRTLLLQNTSSGVNATSKITLQSDTGTGTLFINSSGNSSEGGPNTMTLRNFSGTLRLQGSALQGLLLGTAVQSEIDFKVLSTTEATSTTVASINTVGGISAVKQIRSGTNMICGDTPINGGRLLSISNQDLGTSAVALLVLDTAAVGQGLLFMNGPNRTGDGGANTLTLRNDAGTTRIQSNGGNGINVTPTIVEITKTICLDTTDSTSPTTGSIVTPGGLGISKDMFVGGKITTTVTTQSTTPTTGSIITPGGVGVAKNLNVGENTTIAGTLTTIGTITAANEIAVQRSGAAQLRVYNNGNVTEWTMGQRSVGDHNFKIVSKVGATETECFELRTDGAIRLGGNNFFKYSQGSWTPIAQSTAPGASSPSFSYNVQYGRYVVVGQQVTLSYRLNFNYGGSLGAQWLLIKGIPAFLQLAGGIPEVTANMFRSNWSGLSNPIYTTLWINGYNLPGVNIFDGLSMTVGAYNSGNYITGAFLSGGATDQDLWGTLVYNLPF
ncbi:hypothetical protein QT971_06280 [Microcoleus sp. herbarium19]|uniref:beta strand repeat-containing protein n=1 Tax=Microcoleus sp. herbarium19 TaxID=3055440 RepID=UPI002FD5FF18